MKESNDFENSIDSNESENKNIESIISSSSNESGDIQGDDSVIISENKKKN